MNQGIIAGILSVLFYLTSLFTGGQGQPMQPMDPPITQQSYEVLGQIGRVTADRVTVRRSPRMDGTPLGTVTRNTTLTVLDQSDNWYKIRPRLGSEGWVPEYAVTVEKVERQEPVHQLLGFYPGGDLAYNSLLEHGNKLTSIATLGWQLDSYGGLITDFDPEEIGRSLYFAGNQEMDTYANIHVRSNPTRLLSTVYLRESSIKQIVSTLEEWGLKGALINIGYVPGNEQTELFAFLENLADTLRQKGLKAMVALPWDVTIDFAAVAESVDYIVLKSATLEHAKKPGPVAAVHSVESMLEEISLLVPTDKLILAVSTAGVSWSRAGIPTVLSHQEILELAAREGASVKWDASSKTPYFQYGTDNEVWFENRYSIKYKVDLAEEYDLGGLALQDLGQEDPEIWTRL